MGSGARNQIEVKLAQVGKTLADRPDSLRRLEELIRCFLLQSEQACLICVFSGSSSKNSRYARECPLYALMQIVLERRDLLLLLALFLRGPILPHLTTLIVIVFVWLHSGPG